MTQEPRNITDLDLMAYADALLEPERRREVERYLHEHPEERARIDAFIAQNEALQAHYDKVLTEPVPARLEAALWARGRTSARRFRPLAQAAAVVFLVVTTGVGGWWLGQSGHFSDGAPPYLGEMARAHVSQPMSAQSETASNGSQPLQWLAKRVTLELRAPDLEAEGYRLQGKKLVQVDGRPTVQLRYIDDTGRSLSLFLRTRWQDDAPAMRFAEDVPVPTTYWYQGPLAWTLSGDVAARELHDLAKTIHQSLRVEPQSRQEQAEAAIPSLSGPGQGQPLGTGAEGETQGPSLQNSEPLSEPM